MEIQVNGSTPQALDRALGRFRKMMKKEQILFEYNARREFLSKSKRLELKRIQARRKNAAAERVWRQNGEK